MLYGSSCSSFNKEDNNYLFFFFSFFDGKNTDLQDPDRSDSDGFEIAIIYH